MSVSKKCKFCGADSNPASCHGYCVACGKETTPVRVPEERTFRAYANARRIAARVVSKILLGVGCLNLLCLGVSVSMAPMLSAGPAGAGRIGRYCRRADGGDCVDFRRPRLEGPVSTRAR